MNHDQISDFLEAYRDGVIDDDAARDLAHLIREGGEQADWAMQELALTGWLTQALRQLDEDTFVRSFLERLYAEKGGDEFSQAFTKRLAVETQRVRVQEERETHFKMPFRQLLGSHARRVDGVRRVARRRPRRLWLLVPTCLAIIVGGLVYLMLAAPTPLVAGTFIEASPGVVVLDGDTQRGVKAGSEILATQSVSVPASGHAVVTDGGNNRWRLRSGSMATFMPRQTKGGERTTRYQEALYLQTGGLVGETAQPTLGLRYVITPHATAEAGEPTVFSLSVTAASTYLEVERGSLAVTRQTDGKTIRLAGGFYVVATDAGEFEPLAK